MFVAFPDLYGEYKTFYCLAIIMCISYEIFIFTVYI